MLASAYPVLADGSSLLDARTGAWRLRLHDAVIVRYDAEVDLSCSLPEHRDTSSMSFTVALNQRDTDCSDGAGRGDFAGGGTWFEALGPAGIVVDADIGCACAFAGPLRHAGYPITRGTRYILVLFCYVEDFPYGELVNDYVARYGCDRLGVKTTNADLQRMADERLALMEGAAHIPLGWNAHYAAADKIRPVTGETRDNVHEAARTILVHILLFLVERQDIFAARVSRTVKKRRTASLDTPDFRSGPTFSDPPFGNFFSVCVRVHM